MLTRLRLFGWLASIEALDTPPSRQSALADGYELAKLAVADGLLAGDGDGHGHGTVARALAELESDGWIAWDWTIHAGDPRPEQPVSSLFDERALQRARNIRITPEGYAAFAARQGLGASVDTSHAGASDVSQASERERRYDLFISHASEDKGAVARPLAEALSAMGFAVWYDEEQLEVGSSLRASIDAGLAESRYGVVILSRAFFDKSWAQRELNGLVAREMADGRDVILPLWHDVDAGFLASKAPTIADRFALQTSIGIAEIAERLARRLRRERGRDQLRTRAVSAPVTPMRPPEGDPRELEADEPDSGLEVRAQVVAMLRAKDEIGLRETLRFERREFENGVMETLQRAGDELGSSAAPEALAPVEQKLWARVDRRLGSLLPLLEYQPTLLAREYAALVEFAGQSTPTRSPFSAWIDGARWPVWLVTLIVGTAAVADERFGEVIHLWNQRAAYDDDRPLPVARLNGAAELGAALARARPAAISGPVELWYPAFAVFDSDLLRTHYPEIMRGGGTPDAALGFLSRAGDFLWLCGALAGRDNVETIRFWAASQVHPTVRRRLVQDPALGALLAEALEVDPDVLVDSLDRWMSDVSGPTV
jgi:hypothetical protein